MEVPGVYFESEDRILYDNGTIIYKLTGTTEVSQILYATVDKDGNVHSLPDLLGQKPDMQLFRNLNVRPKSRTVQTTLDLDGLKSQPFLSRHKRTALEPKKTTLESRGNILEPKRTILEPIRTILEPERTILEPKRILFEVKKALNLAHKFDIDLEFTICKIAQKLDSNLKDLVIKYKPESLCFYEKIIYNCSN